MPENTRKCDGKKHRLIEVTCFSQGHDGLAVVRWCKDCGAIVVDHDCDNRTMPGYYVEMKFPLMTYPNQGRS